MWYLCHLVAQQLVMRRTAFFVLLVAGIAAASAQPPERVAIRVNTAARVGPMTPIWAWFGHDEPNYTYTSNGQKLLTALAAAADPVPVFIRVHNLLTSGDGKPALKWGSTNVYTEDANGRAVYDWSIVDRIVDSYVNRKMKPLVQLGFMPEALSSAPADTTYRHFWKPGDPYNDIYTGWTYPPKDYAKWSELCYQLTRHFVEKYGQAEVERWWFEVWNEPDIGYWHGTGASTKQQDFNTLYDFAAAGVKRALPTAKIGGPEVTGPLGANTQQWLRGFLEHTLRGRNAATGQIGSPLDLITFHAKGSPTFQPEGYVRMGVANQLRAIDAGFAIVTSFPEYARTPIVIGESDPEGCAACGVTHYPQNGYRNGTMFPSYTAEQITRTYQLADRHGVNLLGAVSWAFLFEDQPYFDGFRDLATNGIDKPVLNVFRMLGRMRGDRVAAESSAGLSLEAVRDASVRGAPDISALASRSTRSASVLVFNYHDDDVPAPDATIDLTIDGLPNGRATLTHYRVDRTHSNSYERWKAMGSPQSPTPAQYADLENAGQLDHLQPARTITIANGRIVESFSLPRQGVSLVHVTW
jgi:xylan 1,4-beta-xylosidase